MQLDERFDQALAYASALHRTQMRKETQIPYLTHLLGVCSLALGYGADEEEAIAALLHDSLEDGPEFAGIPRVQIEAEIREQFGERVLEMVQACTDTVGDSGPEGIKEDWGVRKRRYLAHMEAATDSGYLLVTGCDKLHNLRSIWQDKQQVGEEIWQRFTGKKEGSLWYYQELGRVMREQAAVGRIPMGLVNEFEGVLAQVG